MFKHVERRADIENHELFYDPWMVQHQAMGDSCPSIVSYEVEGRVAIVPCDADDVVCHFPLRVLDVRWGAAGLGGCAIAAKVGDDNWWQQKRRLGVISRENVEKGIPE